MTENTDTQPCAIEVSKKVVSTLTALRERLLQLAETGDWSELRKTDREIVNVVRQLQISRLKPHFSRELGLLKRDYQLAVEALQHHQSDIKQKMDQHNQDREGIVAYQQAINASSNE